MSREHKYRAWIEEDKQFIYFTLDEMLERHFSYYGSYDIKILKAEKTQYTGEKESRNLIGEYDKKEIYEGDIIKKDGWEDLFLVEFEEGKYVANKIGSPNSEDLDCFLWAVVAGNRFENPELLKIK